MSDILPTIGPVTSNYNSLKKILNFSSLIRLNGSHNTIKWHRIISERIKKINPDAKILLDLPGIKPRTENTKEIKIKKGDRIIFHYGKKSFKNQKLIYVSKPLPLIKKNPYFFSLSDGNYKFKVIDFSKNHIKGISLDSFFLKPKQGLNIPKSIYNNKKQEEIYLKFINKCKKIKYDAIGLSFVQNDKIIKKLKKKYKYTVILSKIENSEGLRNLDSISRHSDAIMIDRGDLGAEIGEDNLFESIIKISTNAKKYGKPLIMATENLDSMLTKSTPTKSEIVSIGFSSLMKADKIMLSDETATSNNWYNTLTWLNKYLLSIKKSSNKNNKINRTSHDLLWESISKISNFPVIIFSRKGIAIDRINQISNNVELVVFTDNQKTYSNCKFRSNTRSFFIKKFDSKMSNYFIYKILKKYKKEIFKSYKEAFLIYISYPRKGSRANTLTIISKKDF